MGRNTGGWGEKRVLTVIENIHYLASEPVKVCSSIARTFTCKHNTLWKKPHILYKNTIFKPDHHSAALMSFLAGYQAHKGADGKDLMSVEERKDLSLR